MNIVHSTLSVAKRALTWVLVLAIQAYRVALSPMLGSTCRYAPSCSAYAIEALQKHGPWRGSLLAAGRIGRCHPFQPGGYDPVPDPAAPRPAEPSLLGEPNGS